MKRAQKKTVSSKQCLPKYSLFHFPQIVSMIGGDEENRTPVRKPLTKAFYECIRWFVFPARERLPASFLRWYPLGHDCGKGVTQFTGTANRRPNPSRGTLGQDESLS